MRFEKGDDVVGEGVVGVDEENAGVGGVRHICLSFLGMDNEMIICIKLHSSSLLFIAVESHAGYVESSQE